MERKLPDEFLEKLIIKGMMVDSHYTVMLSNSFKKDYFTNESVSEIWYFISEYFKQYNNLPEKTTVLQSVDDKDGCNEIFSEIESIDYEISKNYDHLFHETNQYLKEKAFKDAILQGIELIDAGKNPLEYKDIIENALIKDLTTDIGINYWNDLGKRLERIMSQKDLRIPSYFPVFDEFLGGGFKPYTLSVIMSRIHGFKSNFLINLAARQTLHGYNPLIVSLEMSEDSICQRLDSIYTKLDINKIYTHKPVSQKMVSGLKEIKTNNGLGNLIVKEFPTGKANVSNIKAFIKELNYRGIFPNPVYVDYLQLLKGVNTSQQRHEQLKHISEDLRALSLDINAPVISVVQMNRENMYMDFKDIDMMGVAGAIDIAATADFMAVFGKNEEDLIYKSELHYKILKNRLGGRVGEFGKFFVDACSLKMYDDNELDMWINDAMISGDNRFLKNQK